MTDGYTMEMRLCDEDGMADLDLLAWMRALGGHPTYVGRPFACTGSAHLAGEHVCCTNPFHQRAVKTYDPARADAAHVAVLARETIDFLADAPKDDPHVVSLLASAEAAERVALRLYNQRPILLQDIISRDMVARAVAASTVPAS